MGSLEVNILGQKYIIKGDAPAEYIKRLADFVDERLKEVYEGAPGITPLKASILAALNIADELHKTKKECQNISQSIKSIEDKADTIIKLFD
jgi:cell division protein ZapA (FtsZ GTPase activity inhibitor)